MLGRQKIKRPKRKGPFYSLKRGLGFKKGYAVQQRPALEERGDRLYCHFCGGVSDKTDARLPDGRFYCPLCCSYGRVTSTDQLLFCPFPKKYFSPSKQNFCTWSGQLSPFQEQVSQQCLHYYRKETAFLLWAVTGAGKTEIIYRLCNACLQEGKRLAYVAPRLDVTKELYVRLQQNFPSIRLCILHGSEHHYFISPFTVCTLPQLVRFYQAFDLLIVDEADAYPLYQNAYLQAWLKKALQKDGCLLYMTATRQKAFQNLPYIYLPLRYHLAPLPKIRFLPLYDTFSSQKLSQRFCKEIQRLRRPCLIFYPSIPAVLKAEKQLKAQFPHLKMAAVHSQDAERALKIEQFRKRKLDLLLSTSILERGVTFSFIEVWVYQADHPVFTKEVLLQIAGRAGRKKGDTDAKVYFWSAGPSWAMFLARWEQRQHNRKGREMQLALSTLS